MAMGNHMGLVAISSGPTCLDWVRSFSSIASTFWAKSRSLYQKGYFKVQAKGTIIEVGCSHAGEIIIHQQYFLMHKAALIAENLHTCGK